MDNHKMPKSRNNHYVPIWYQKGFLLPESDKLHYVDLSPAEIHLDDGRVRNHKSQWRSPPARCFVKRDLYTTVFGAEINDEVERFLFGQVDTAGAIAVGGYIQGGEQNYHTHFQRFYEYLSLQRLRTPKGLKWIKSKYTQLDQVQLMREMQSLQHLNVSMWTEGVREIVSAKNSDTKFIVTDQPVTIYNRGAPPDSEMCTNDNDPEVALLGSQTIFALDANNCLILTNYEYANAPNQSEALKKRTNPRNYSQSMVKTISMIRMRTLSEDEVRQINYVLKSRAVRYIAAGVEDYLYPEKHIKAEWESFYDVLLPPANKLYEFGGEIYVGYKDGSTYYQDAYGRTRNSDYLSKSERVPEPDQLCACGSGKKFKRCCLGKNDKPRGNVLSIRERNMTFYNGVISILGLGKGVTWEEVRSSISDKQVEEIHRLLGAVWPPDTLLSDLLPRPDVNVSRLLYSGIVDPRQVPGLVTSLCLYFDEVLIINPFANPSSRSPKYSPTESPSQYKQDTLRNVILLVQLAPFIEQGFVVLLPDPCDFSPALREELIALAGSRNTVMDEDDRDQFKHLFRDDFERTLSGLPISSLKSQIRTMSPELSDDELSDVLDHMVKKREEDPLALLQEDAFRKGGQLHTLVMMPNYEMSLYLCQLTGSIPYTNMRFRWKEFTENSEISEVLLKNDVQKLTSTLPLVLEPTVVLDLRARGRLARFRRQFCHIHSRLRSAAELDRSEVDELISANSSAVAKAASELERNGIRGENHYTLTLSYLIPENGFFDAGVERLLVTHSFGQYSRNTPLAIFVQESC
jgi:hypothetical protein